MKKVFLILQTMTGESINTSTFRPEVFKTKKLAIYYCNYLKQRSQNKKIKFTVIQTNMYQSIEFVKEICF